MTKIEITESGYVAGEYHEKGEVLEVTERQASCGLRRGRVKIFSEVEKKQASKPRVSEKTANLDDEDLLG